MKSPRSPASPSAQRPRAYGVKADGAPLESVQEHNEALEQAAFGELLSYSLERLSKEPELLKAERDQLSRHGQVRVPSRRSIRERVFCMLFRQHHL